MKIARYFFIITLLITLIIPYPLLAVDFNPNYIISDEELQYADSMDKRDILAFLKDKGSYIANLITDDWEGVKRNVADIIYRAAQDNNINPKYILVKLQKEQSLITETNPSQKALDWATGYGICDSCSKDDPALEKHKGFGTQVDSAAGIMRWYYNNVSQENWIKRPNTNYTIDDTTVIPQNYATAFLYTYTPHLHGNENFWKLWQKWFQQVYPNGTLMKSTDNPDIYLIQNGEKRKFKNATSLVTRYDSKLVITVPASELSRYTPGADISLPNYAIVRNNNYYYLLDYDFKRKFESYDTVKKLGYNPDEIIDVTSADLTSYVDGPLISTNVKNPTGKIVRIMPSGSLYLLKDNQYHPIFDDAVVHINFPHFDIERITSAELGDDYTRGDPVLLKDGTIFGITGDNKIYVVEHSKKRHIATADVFNSLGYDWENIVWVSKNTGDLHETGEALYATIDTTNTTSDIKQIAENNSEQTNEPEPTNNTSAKKPVDYMVRTASSDTSYIGPEFNTEIDNYIISDFTSGEILAGKNINTVRPIASLTKVMTGYQLLLDGIRMGDSITYDSSKHKSSYHVFRIVDGERVRVRDMMYAMLVSSLNTPSRMLVNRDIVQDIAFVSRMNVTAKNIGLSNTRFADTSGFNTGNVSTAKEYNKLFSVAVKNKTMQEFLETSYYEYDELKDVDGKAHHFDSHSNKLLKRNDLSYTILASKTGFLYEAGSNLTMLVKRNSDGKQFVITIMGNPDFDGTTRFDGFNAVASWAMKTF